MKKTLRNTLYTMTAMSLSLGAGEALAMDTFLMNSRSAAMGGAGVACSTDANAQYYNPAAFGFFSKQPTVAAEKTEAPLSGLTTEGEVEPQLLDAAKEAEEKPQLSGLANKDWGLDVNVGGGARIHGEIGDYLQTLADVDYTALSTNGIQTEEDIRDLLKIAKSLSGVDDAGNAFSTQGAANVAARVGHVGVGVYGMAQASGRVLNIDTANLGIGLDAATLSADIETANTTVVLDGVYVVFTTSQYDQLLAAGLSPAAIDILDNLAATEGVTADQVAQLTDILVEVASSTGTGTLSANSTTLIAEGFGVVEVPVTYGYAVNDNISIGGNIKYMKGRVYGTSVRVFDDNNTEVLDNIDSNYQETSTFGIDLGIMGRQGMFQYGLVVRNLNSPKFDGFTDTLTGYVIDDVKIKPQAAAGIALVPFETLTLALDLDLTANETSRPDYKTQFIRGGLEWDTFKILALRVGAYSNLDDSDIGLVYTAGIGLNLWAARLDVAGAYADKKINFEGEEVPTEVNVMARLAVDF